MLHADIKMDGSSVNWAFLKEIQKHREEEELHAGILKVLLKLYPSYYMIVLHVVQIILVSDSIQQIGTFQNFEKMFFLEKCSVALKN